jgi:hypothetical protein
MLKNEGRVQPLSDPVSRRAVALETLEETTVMQPTLKKSMYEYRCLSFLCITLKNKIVYYQEVSEVQVTSNVEV